MLKTRKLLWTSQDELQLATTIIKHFLDCWSKQSAVDHSYLTLVSENDQANLGLQLTVLQSASDLAASLKNMQQNRIKSPDCFQLVVIGSVPHTLANHMAEAGAHLVVYQIGQLPNVLQRIVTNFKSVTDSFNPLTGQLLNRLPWPDLP